MDKTRVEAFSDGVLAIAITLLIIEVRIPEAGEAGLWHALVDAWPQFAAYFVSFFVIGIIWVNHHGLMSLVRQVDRTLLFFNLLLLLFVVLIPFSTALLAEYIESGDNTHVAAAVYIATMLCVAFGFQGLFQWIARRAELEHHAMSREQLHAANLRFGAGVAAYSAMIGLSFVSAIATLVAHFLMAVYYMFDQLLASQRS